MVFALYDNGLQASFSQASEFLNTHPRFYSRCLKAGLSSARSYSQFCDVKNTCALSSLHHPVSVFSAEDYGVNSSELIPELKDYFFKLEWDSYLSRQKKLEYLIRHVPDISAIDSNHQPLFKAYYSGEAEESCLDKFLYKLNGIQQKEFEKIKSHRRRSVASFKIFWDENKDIIIERLSVGHFEQKEAAVAEKNEWTLINRTFQQADPGMFSANLQKLIRGLSLDILSYHPTLESMDFVTHFTQIVATAEDRAVSNAPEGIHQDGMDYIVSALVIDLDNAEGGKSLIYGADKNTLLFETKLRPGQGILQPDKGTDLWHTVEPIRPKNKEKPAYRSTLGFDFNLNFKR